MMQTNGYHDYPANKPTSDDYYLVSVKSALIIKVGLSPGPPVLIARYNPTTQKWTTVLGSSSIGLDNIANDVIAWRNLPRP